MYIFTFIIVYKKLMLCKFALYINKQQKNNK